MIVNFGCGGNPAPSSGYLNVDGSLTVLLARLPLPATAFGSRADFVQVIRANRIRYRTASGLKLDNDSVEGFYASHVLEHLSRSQCDNLLLRVRGWLKPSGFLRVALPDLRLFASSYIAGTTDAPQFVSSTGLAMDGRKRWETIFGHAHHRWMYDAASFSETLARLGYRDIRQCEMGQGSLPGLSCLDIPSRQHESFYVEASK